MGKPIEIIQVCGFRGFPAPFRLNFRKGKSIRSMIVYGGNGTGKSSMTDSLEWLQSGKIQRLAREGAGPRSYAHRSVDSDPFVRITVDDPPLGTIGLVQDLNRITQPREEGPLADLRAAAPHPWQIRSEDLARFVLLTKSQRFDELASLMGFLPQGEYQKQLRRAASSLANDRERCESEVRNAMQRLEELVGEENTALPRILQGLQNTVRPFGSKVTTLSQAEAVRDELGKKIASDPASARLAKARGLERRLHLSTVPSQELWNRGSRLKTSVDQVAAEGKDTLDSARIDLFEAGLKLLSRVGGAESGRCPLCGESFDGDLRSHVEAALTRLSEVKRLQGLARQALESLADEIERHKSSLGGVPSLAEESRDLGLESPYEQLHEAYVKFLEGLEAFLAAANTRPSEWDETCAAEYQSCMDRCREAAGTYEVAHSGFATAAQTLIRDLDEGDGRAAMISARDQIRDVLDAFRTLMRHESRARELRELVRELDRIVRDYVDESIVDVERRFDAISDDVARYFGVLEEATPGLGRPALKLLKDQDRAVVLEIEFRGDRIDHAYGYLSQSQLNSFGLAVFLASARNVNAGFPFLVLDDVINSFDSYKRPRLARLLKEEFDDVQLLVLTHDQVWWDRLATDCPTWIRVRLKRYDLASGPISEEGMSSLDEIGAFINDDRPELAGRSLGPLMELELQEMAEAFEALVPFNRRNEYTLDPLLDRVRIRVKDKLGKSHELHTALKAMMESTSFRNLSAHWKNPASPLTHPELREVYDRWLSIRRMVRCSLPTCGTVVFYKRDSGSFVCRCGETTVR